MFRWLVLALLLVPQDDPMGRKLEARTNLRDLRGNRRSLADLKGSDAIVLAFLGTDCPLSNLYVPRLLELEAELRARKVRFIAVYPNENESLDAVAIHADERAIPFLVLKDAGQKLAAALGIQRTPEIAVLDRELALRYRGRIDDQYGVAYRKEKAERRDLALAIEAVLSAKPATPTEADGCLIGRRSDEKADVTFTRDVLPILQKSCQPCHRPGQIGPFPLITYEDAADHAAMIREVVVQKRMPPWHADPRHGKFMNDRSLKPEEIRTLTSWVAAGTPRGDAKDAPPPIAWPKDWRIGTPDVVLSIPKEIDVPAQGVMPYLNFLVPTDFAEDRWVTKAEVRPSDARVVHHVLVYVKLPGKETYQLDGTTTAFAGWVPGDMPFEHPEDTAVKLPKGAELQFEIHYTPNGLATKDRTSLGLVFAKEPPARESRMNIFAKLGIKIPAGASHHREESFLTFRQDVRILSALPHMHVRGKSWKYEAIYPDGRVETILNVPRWDFNWQSVYRFDPPLALPKGTKIRSTAHWDNSDNNPANPDPSKDVRYGLQTWEEMMNGWVQWVPEKADR
jgi:peroxiredoxin